MELTIFVHYRNVSPPACFTYVIIYVEWKPNRLYINSDLKHGPHESWDL